MRKRIAAVAEQLMRYPYKLWGFGEGIALEALWQAAAFTGEKRYGDFVLACYESWLAREIVEADHCASGWLLLALYQSQADQRYLERALRMRHHMASLPEDPVTGARFHRPQHPQFSDYLYVDCMEVDAPFLALLGAVTGDTAYTDEAVQQINAYAELLQDPASGLFYHQFDRSTRRVNGAFWGRGNGWALLGLVKTLQVIPREHSGYEGLRARLERLIAALAHTQQKSGGWPTVLNMPDSYAEASLPAMFSVGIHDACRHGLVAPDWLSVAQRARQRMLELLHADGTMPGISIATPPGDAPHYAAIPTADLFPWGQGPALLALVQAVAYEGYPSTALFQL